MTVRAVDANTTEDLLCELIRFASVSSESNQAISEFVAKQLRAIDFDVEIVTYQDHRGVKKLNVVAVRHPNNRSAPAPKRSQPVGLAYFAHTDVVPAKDWTGPSDESGKPAQGFRPVLRNGRIYGRGSCDMKGSIAALISAAASIPQDSQTHPLWIICTADEEVGFHGAREVVKHSSLYRDLVRFQPLAVIGEPTQLQIVHAHKGITGFHIKSQGRAAHSSTDDGINANDAMVPMLSLLHQISVRTRLESQLQDQRFNPSHLSWNYGISDGSTAINIVPGESEAWVSFRPMPEITGKELIDEVRSKASELGLQFELYAGGNPLWVEPTEPFLVRLGELTQSIPQMVCYGTDGGEFSELKFRVVLGPGGISQAHTDDEWISRSQLAQGKALFTKLIQTYCSPTLL